MYQAPHHTYVIAIPQSAKLIAPHAIAPYSVFTLGDDTVTSTKYDWEAMPWM